MKNKQNDIKKSYSYLVSLKETLPDNDPIHERFANTYNDQIGRLISLGFNDLEEFKVPSHEIKHSQMSGTMFSKEKYVDRNFLLMKINAILNFFTVSSEDKEIGFKLE